jgi:hypothetical protein
MVTADQIYASYPFELSLSFASIPNGPLLTTRYQKERVEAVPGDSYRCLVSFP